MFMITNVAHVLGMVIILFGLVIASMVRMATSAFEGVALTMLIIGVISNVECMIYITVLNSKIYPKQIRVNPDPNRYSFNR